MQATQTKAVPKAQSAKKKALQSPVMSQEELLQQTVEASAHIEPGVGQCVSCGVAIDAGITWCDFCDPTPATEEPEDKRIFGTKPLVEYSDQEWEQAYIAVQRDAGQLPALALKWLNPKLLQEDPENERGPVNRESDADLDDLADSIKERGVLEPLRVYQAGDALFLQSGHRRRAAAILAGLALVPCIIVPAPKGPLDQAVDRLTSNLQRKDLSPMEKARSLKALMEANPITQTSLAQRLGISQGAIGNLLRILELPQPVQTMVAEGKLTAGHAVALLSINEPGIDWSGKETQTIEEVVISKAKIAVANSMSVRDLEKSCREQNAAAVRNRKYAQEEATRREARRANEEAAALKQKEAVEGGALTPHEIAMLAYDSEMEAWHERTEANRRERLKQWPALLDDLLGWGGIPSLAHVKLVGRVFVTATYGYYDTDTKREAVEAIDKAGSTNEVLNILTKLAVAQLRPHYDYMQLSPSYAHSGWANRQWGLPEKLQAAWEERGLVDPEQPVKPEPPKQEETVEELAKAS